MGPALIELKGITCASGDGGVIFEDAHLSLYAGERVLIAGPQASGKGPLLKLISGLERPIRGEVSLFGKDIRGLKERELNDLRKRMGFILNDNILISNLKVIENAALPLIYHSRLTYRESMERALELLDLAGYRGDPWALPGPLPLYARKEVCVARAISMEPDIVICESFTEGLTGDEKERLSNLLAGYQSGVPGRLLVLTADDESEARFFKADRIVRIEGRGFAGQAR